MSQRFMWAKESKGFHYFERNVVSFLFELQNSD